jgi:hypothetical protein
MANTKRHSDGLDDDSDDGKHKKKKRIAPTPGVAVSQEENPKQDQLRQWKSGGIWGGRNDCEGPKWVSLIPEPLSVTGIIDGEVDRGSAPGSDIPEHTGLFE